MYASQYRVYSLQEVLTQLLIPNYSVNGGRKLHVVKYSMKKALRPFLEDRAGLLTKCVPINMSMARGLLNHGYKQYSKFGRWCPVKVSAIMSLLI